MKLQVQKFIEENSNWEELLSNSPYCLKIKREGNYILLKYSQIESDFNNPIVRECRGLVFKKENHTYLPVCVPFYKFGNYGEGYADTIDWESARVQEKIDGSLIKIWDDNGWHISTNSTIDAFKAPLENLGFQNFGDLFLDTLNKNNGSCLFDFLNENYTYMFELVGPANRVTIEYKEPAIYCLGCRNNFTLQEEQMNQNIQSFGIKIPKTYPLTSLEDCIDAVNAMDATQEGFVVVDKNYHRVKVKSPAYLAVARIRNNNVVTRESILELLLTNKLDDFYAYCNDFKKFADKVVKDYEDFLNNATLAEVWFYSQPLESKKEFAMLVKNSIYAPFLFKKYNNPELRARDFYNNLPVKNLNVLIERSKNEN